jgi:hypothetical protein
MAPRTPLYQNAGQVTELGSTDQLLVPAGSAASPSLAIGETGSGFYLDAAGTIGMSYGGAIKIKFFSSPAAMVQRAASDYTIPFAIQGAAAVTPQWQMLGTGAAASGGAATLIARGTATSVGPVAHFAKTRATAFNVAGVAAASGDTLGMLQFNGDDASDATKPVFNAGATFAAMAAEAWTTIARGTRFVLSACKLGAVALTEIVRFDADNGFQMAGANVVVDMNRVIRRRVFPTLVALNAAVGTPVEGMMAVIQDCTTLTFMAAAAGTGTNTAPVTYLNGAWRVG